MSSRIATAFLVVCLCIFSIWKLTEGMEEIPKDCSKCGIISENKPRMIGGSTVEVLKAYPWMAALMQDNEIVSGGAIISDRFILTAAHCVVKRGKQLLLHERRVAFLTSSGEVEPGPPIEEIFAHPQFDNRVNKHDVALLKLKEKISCGTYKNPICLPPANANLPLNTAMRIVGWGVTEMGDNPTVPDKLQESKARNVDFEVCAAAFGGRNLKEHFVCLMGDHTTACSGDSGGPVILNRQKKFFAMGVASGSSPGCNISFPFLYASITRNVEWITKVSGVSLAKF